MKLTTAQRRAFFDRDWPILAGKGKPPVDKGYRCDLSPRLAFIVIGVHLRPGRWRLEYRVIDDRDHRFWLLPAGVSLATDDSGTVAVFALEEEIGYTRNPKRRKADPLPTVAPDLQNVITLRGRLHDAEHRRSEDPMAEANRDVARVSAEMRELAKRAVRMGVDPLQALGPVAREIKAQHQQLNQRDAA